MIDHKIEYYKKGNKKSEKYRLNDGKRHNDNGPAVILYWENGNIFKKEYFKNGEFHNENGPAYILYKCNGTIYYEEYWLYNNQIPKNEYYAFINEWDNKDDLKSYIIIHYGV